MMFRKQTPAPIEPAPPEPTPLSPEQQLAAAERSLRAAKDFCGKLDEEYRLFNHRREAAHKIFTQALRRYTSLQATVEKRHGDGIAPRAVTATA